MISAIYPGVVHHARLKPQKHRLRYRVFNLLLDLDELPTLNSRLFGNNRTALIAFHDKDHGDRSGAPLRPWVEARLAAAGIAFDGGRVQLLCMPRVLNHVFNPLSLYFCYGRDGALTAIVYEVNNTFGESHAYVLRADAPDPAGRIVQRCDKRFYVSPFQPMDLTYDFNILPPGEETSTAMVVKNAEGPVLTAAFAGKRLPLTDANLFRQWLAHPLLSLKVLAGIHWEAVLIWFKGGKFHSNPRLAARTATGRLFPRAHESR